MSILSNKELLPVYSVSVTILLLSSLCIQLTGSNEHNVVDSDEEIESTEPSWVYKCLGDNGCQRSTQPLPEEQNSTIFYPNVDLCRSACGRFGGLWPRPAAVVLSPYSFPIHPNYIRYDLSVVPEETRELLQQMTRITTNNMLLECGGNVTEVVKTPVVVFLAVQSRQITLDWDTDEVYSLDLRMKDAEIIVKISARTVFGARHGLETFSQLVSSSRPDYSNQKSCGLRITAGAKISDHPVYSHRGLLIDTSRNFIPLKDIKRMIDGMAATKMNVFHWHVTDSQSFPLESTRVPQFTRYGAYTPTEIYKVDDQRELINYALARGVRVVIEIDAPAHAGNGWQWGKEFGYGDLAVCVNEEPWRKLCIEPPCGQLNPANPAMYRVLRDLYRDIAEMVPQPNLLHMGGDEVFLACWNSSAEIVSYMKTKSYDLTTEGFIQLWSEFHATALEIWDEELRALGRSLQPVLLWSSELTKSHRIQKYLDKNRYVIQVWEPIESPLLTDLLQLGYRVISVPKNIWYLDHGFWGVTVYANWRRMYAHMIPTDPNVLGGEVAMWSEYVDQQGLDPRIWPRAAAVAERLWRNPSSPASVAEPRLQRLRSRLIARGLRPDVVSPGWCQQNDNRCL